MANVSVTNTFVNSTTADASQVNQNFTDIINGTSDGTKDFSIAALTVAGTLTANGAINLGNSTSDDITVTGSIASTIPIKTTNSFDIGSTTIGLRALYFGANSQTVNIKGSSSMSATWTMTLPVSAGTSDYVLKTDGNGVTSWRAWTAPTIQKFTSSSGTYTTPADVKWIRVRMVGGGGGGAGGGTAAGTSATAGGQSTFGTSLLTCNGGSAGGWNGTGAGGGSASLGTGPIGIAIPGGSGTASNASASGQNSMGPAGASSPFGGGGGGSYAGNAGNAAAPNSGSGGGGGGAPGGGLSGGSGAAGGFIDAIITAPSSSYSYVVGASGAAGGAGTGGVAGNAGGSGVIIVEEYYQ
jgi:hypothetical protein